MKTINFVNMSSLWMLTAQRINKGVVDNKLHVIGFFDKKRKESRDEALTRIVQKDEVTRLDVLAQLAGVCGVTYKQFMSSIKKDVKKLAGNRKEIENRLLALMDVRSFKMNICSVGNDVRTCTMSITKN